MEQQQPVVMQLPKELVEAQIKTLVLDACLKNGSAMVTAMVEHVLREKVDYGRTNVLDKAISSLVLGVAELSAKEWVSEQAPVIREAVRKRLTAEKTKVITSLCDKLTSSLLSNIRVNVSIDDNSR